MRELGIIVIALVVLSATVRGHSHFVPRLPNIAGGERTLKVHRSRASFCCPQCVCLRVELDSRWTCRFSALSTPMRAHHGRAVELDDQEQGLYRGLPLLEMLLGLPHWPERRYEVREFCMSYVRCTPIALPGDSQGSGDHFLAANDRLTTVA